MKASRSYQFSGQVTVFHGLSLPETATPAGYAALIDALELNAPIPRTLVATSSRHVVKRGGCWHLLTPRHAPAPTLEGHLTFALKHEGIDLAVLSDLFKRTGPQPIEDIVRSTPTGKYARKIWFLYEWLTGQSLALADATQGSYVALVDPDKQYAIAGTNVKRQRVRNNLPGTRNFCPMVFRTDALDAFQALELAAKAQETIDEVASDILSRTAAFLLLKDSKSSFAIENEKPPEERIQRWGRAIGEAGRNPTDFDELLRLQEIVIGDSRFVSLGLRTEGGFVGEHDRDTRMPVPDHISAKPEDLASLIDGLCEFEQGAALDLDPIVAAAILAFGFVYVHPFGDGNGRIHRYLVHHILAKRGFNPAGIVFPVSAAIQDRIDEYREVLESYSKRLLPCIQWTPTSEGNVSVENETADLYRFFDATPHAEFLYSCAKRTIEIDLPDETAFLTSFDRFSVGVDAMLEMSNVTKDLLFRFLHQNSGKLSKRAKSKEFASLGEDEVAAVEALYNECFE